MKNGDRLTGKVKGLQAGVLKFDLNYVDGTISINWNKVARLESSTLFLIQLEDGSVVSGKLITPEAAGGTEEKIEILESGQVPLAVGKSDVVRITETSESLLQRFSGEINLGSQYSKGNSTAQYNIGTDVEYQESRWGGRAVYSSNLSSSTGASTSTRNQVDLDAYRLLPWKNYFYAGSVGFLQSSVQGIQRQTNVGIGVGRYLKNTNMIRLSVLGGLGWQGTHYVPSARAEQSQNVAVALLAANLEVFSFKKTRLNVSASLAPALTDSGRYFSRVNASYYLKVFGKIDWNFSFYGNWDTKPPAQLQSSDYGTSTGLSYTFGNK
jgi:putative salt-induced outer membrane protein YdiY